METLTPEETATLPVPGTAVRKPVSDEQMRRALADSNNTNIIKKVLKKYIKLIHEDDLDNCGLHALWRALQYHDDAFHQKFTTSLYRFTEWECRRELRRQKNARKHQVSLGDEIEDARSLRAEDQDKRHEEMTYVRECMQLLSQDQRQLVEEYFIEQWTMDEIAALHGMAKESVRQKLDWIVRRLRDIREEDDESVYSVSV